jgi:hypothetical protein
MITLGHVLGAASVGASLLALLKAGLSGQEEPEETINQVAPGPPVGGTQGPAGIVQGPLTATPGPATGASLYPVLYWMCYPAQEGKPQECRYEWRGAGPAPGQPVRLAYTRAPLPGW